MKAKSIAHFSDIGWRIYGVSKYRVAYVGQMDAELVTPKVKDRTELELTSKEQVDFKNSTHVQASNKASPASEWHQLDVRQNSDIRN